ncbi:MAG: 4-vinyl reductase [Candidatus Diapherotrites archaeon]|nr:4-vinyl reductase [Candidatus Diapherotrites archaeon]
MLNTFYDKFIFTNGLQYRHGNFFLVDMPFLICPTEVLSGLLCTDNPDFERHVYYGVKRSVSERMVGQFKIEFGFTGDKMVSFLEQFFVASGWGTIKNVDLDMQGRKAIVQVLNNPLTAQLRGKVKTASDHILRGILAGIFTKVFAENVECVETHCVALGGEDCEFIIKRQHEFDFSDKRVQEQLEAEI